MASTYFLYCTHHSILARPKSRDWTYPILCRFGRSKVDIFAYFSPWVIVLSLLRHAKTSHSFQVRLRRKCAFKLWSALVNYRWARWNDSMKFRIFVSLFFDILHTFLSISWLPVSRKSSEPTNKIVTTLWYNGIMNIMMTLPLFISFIVIDVNYYY